MSIQRPDSRRTGRWREPRPSRRRAFLGACAAVLAGGCVGGGDARSDLVVATTTSTYDSGLLDELHPPFEAEADARLKVLSQGTGAALRTGRDGDCDVVFVHAPDAEREFVADGYGTARHPVMATDFLVVGPPDDPAGVADVAGDQPTAAFARIADAESAFLSRGDDSGTHRRERQIWAAAGVDPGGPWYRESGRGMGDTLVTAGQTGAYTLVDRATFAATRENTDLELAVHVEGDAAFPSDDESSLLANPYHVVPVSQSRHPDVAAALAEAYVEYLTGPAGQDRIAAFAVGGETPFVPYREVDGD